MLKPKKTLKEVRESFIESIKQNPQFRVKEFTQIFNFQNLKYLEDTQKYPQLKHDNILGLSYFVDEKSCRFGMMQAGSITTIIDVLTQSALSCFFESSKSRLSASLQMNQSVAIKQNQLIDIIMKVKSITKDWAQVSCEIYNQKNQLCVSGFQIMSFLDEKQRELLLSKTLNKKFN